MLTPLVSVVIPTRNRPESLSLAIESALAQGVEDLQVIVADHGSAPETADIIRSFGAKIVGLSLGQEGRGGPAVPRNAALKESSGHYVAFLDDDDVWQPNKLTTQLTFLESRRDCVMTSSNAVAVDEYGSPVSQRYLRAEIEPPEFPSFAELVRRNFVITSTAVIQRKVLHQLNGFSESSFLHLVEDYELWLRVAARYRLHYSSETLINYRLPSNASISLGLKRRRRALLAGLKDKVLWKHSFRLALAIARETGRIEVARARGQ